MSGPGEPQNPPAEPSSPVVVTEVSPAAVETLVAAAAGKPAAGSPAAGDATGPAAVVAPVVVVPTQMQLMPVPAAPPAPRGPPIPPSMTRLVERLIDLAATAMLLFFAYVLRGDNAALAGMVVGASITFWLQKNAASAGQHEERAAAELAKGREAER